MSSELERYISEAKQAGCPADQVYNLLAAGVVFQPRQLAASAAARSCDRSDGPDQLGYGGARGGGKSHWMLALLGADDAQRVPEYKGLILRKVGAALKESFEDLLRRAFPGLAGTYEYIPSRNRLEFENGSLIILGHYKNESDIEKYLGLEYDGIGIEECTTLSSSKYKNIRTCARTSKPGWKPRVYSTTNPGGIGHAYYKQLFIMPYRRGIHGSTVFIPATVDDNKYVNAEYKAVLDSLTGWQLRAWRYGDWDIAAGQFFTTFRHDIHVIPSIHIPRRIPTAWEAWGSLDYGFTHYTAAYLLVRDGDGIIYIAGEHAARRWQIEPHADAIKDMLARRGLSPELLRTFVAGVDIFQQKDPGPTIAANYRKLGIRLKKANTDRINGAAELLALLGDYERNIPPRLYISDECQRLIECIPSLEHDPNRPEDVLKIDTDDDGIGGDDPYDAARYGIMAGKRATMSSGKKDLYGKPQQAASEPRAARSDDEIDALLDESDE